MVNMPITKRKNNIPIDTIFKALGIPDDHTFFDSPARLTTVTTRRTKYSIITKIASGSICSDKSAEAISVTWSERQL
jgi:hypothetical protein